MNERDLLFFKIVSSAVHGEDTDFSSEAPALLEKVLDLAVANKTPGIVFYALSNHKNRLPDVIKNKLVSIRDSIIVDVFREESRMPHFRELVGGLEKEGLQYAVLKGFALKKLYPKPELRTMVDIDIFFSGDDYKRSEKVFEALGYAGEEEYEHSQCHMLYSKPGAYFVESHFNLVFDGYLNRKNIEKWQDELCNDPYYVEYDGIRYKGMNPDDMFVHLLVHQYNHLFSSCSDLRQIVDYAVFLNSHSIDYKRVFGMTDRMNLTKMARAVLLICEKYMGISACGIRFSQDEETLADELLEEIIYRNGKRRASDEILSFRYKWIYTMKRFKRLIWIQEIFRNLFIKKLGFKKSVERASVSYRNFMEHWPIFKKLYRS